MKKTSAAIQEPAFGSAKLETAALGAFAFVLGSMIGASHA